MTASVTVEVAAARLVVVIGRAESGAEHFLDGDCGGGAVGPSLELAGVSARQNLLADLGRHFQVSSRQHAQDRASLALGFAFGEEPVYEGVPEFGGHQLLQGLPRRVGSGTS